MTVPSIHHWLAGDAWNAARLNEVADTVSWLQNPPTIEVRRRTTTQAISGQSWTKVSFDTLVSSYDPYDMWDVGTPTQITFAEPGWYSCEIYTTWSNFAAVDTRVIMALSKNDFGSGLSGGAGLVLRADQDTQTAGSGQNLCLRKEATFFFNSGDFVFLGVYQEDTSSHNLANTSDAECSGVRIRWVSN